MADDKINVDPQQRLAFAKKLLSFEEQMKTTVQQLKTRLETASGHLQDPGSAHYIAEGLNLVDELEKLLDGGITQIGTEQAGKATAQIQLMDSFAAGVGQ